MVNMSNTITMSSKITETGDCSGCGKHVEQQYEHDELDYCECDIYKYKIYNSNVSKFCLVEWEIRATSLEEAFSDVRDALNQVARYMANAEGLYVEVTGPNGVYEIKYETAR